MVNFTSSGSGATLADMYKALFGENWSGFSQENGGGLRALDSVTVQAQSSNEGSHS
jgi:hypothetical protein